MNIKGLAEYFVKDAAPRAGVHGDYSIRVDQTSASKTPELWFTNKYGKTELIALKAGPLTICEGGRLEYASVRMAWGNMNHLWGAVPIQMALESHGAAMLPSAGIVRMVRESDRSVLRYGALKKLTNIHVLECTGPETFTVMQASRYTAEEVEATRHFFGATLIKVTVNKAPPEDSNAADGPPVTLTLLIDVDRQELKHKRFNAFITRLDGDPETIAEAYESLKPAKVKAAERAGAQVLRHGEFFFVTHAAPEVKGPTEQQHADAAAYEALPFAIRNHGAKVYQAEGDTVKLKELGRLAEAAGIVEEFRRSEPRTLEGGAGTGSHTAQRVVRLEDGTVLASGEVTHARGEHAPLELVGWFEVLPNTARKSLTLGGDVD